MLMSRYFVLIKRKGSKRWLGAIPAKPKAKKADIVRSVRRNLKPGFVAKVISSDELRKFSRARSAGFGKGKRKLSARSKRKLLAN